LRNQIYFFIAIVRFFFVKAFWIFVFILLDFSFGLSSFKQRHMYQCRYTYSTPSFIIISFTSLLFFSLACFLACRDRSCFASSSSSPSFVDKSFFRCLTAFCLSEYCYYDIYRTIDDKWWELGSFVPTWCGVSYAVRSIKIIIRVGEWQMSDRWWWSCARRDDRYTSIHVSIDACFMSSVSRPIIIISRSASCDDKSTAKFAFSVTTVDIHH
jgi:hypothetical protein